ncbi:hypothetical protein RZS08_22090, partial [Arthrospira platensis SPKY1]|nr:hypothetical protein [Arthrospira platensis SPKY1]
MGQTLRVTESATEGLLHWTSRDADHRVWFEGEFELPGLSYIQGTDDGVGERLQRILEAICTFSPTFLLHL